MRIPAEYIADELLPYLRAKIAEILYSDGMSQSEIASYLGITQAMVSKYLAGRYKRPPEEVARRLDELSVEVGRFILFGGSKEDAIVLLTRRIIEMFQSGFLCPYYAEYAGISVDACRSIYSVQRDRMEVIEKLSIALNALLKLEGFAGLLPEVRSNFAYALPSPVLKEDVAAVPGRITLAKGKPFALPPEFGASSFTAGILLEVAKKLPEIRSVINIRYGEDIEKALKELGFKVARVRTGGLSEEEAIKRIASVFDDLYDAVVDEGGEGVEPVVYVFGRDPLEVVEKVKKILEVLRDLRNGDEE